MEKIKIKGFFIENGKYFWVRYRLCDAEIMKVTVKENYVDLQFSAIDGTSYDLNSDEITILSEVVGLYGNKDENNKYYTKELSILEDSENPKAKFFSDKGESKFLNLDKNSLEVIIQELQNLRTKLQLEKKGR